ncbi:MAG: Abi family protein [Bacteroidota bacterium]
MNLPKHELLFSQIWLNKYVSSCNGDSQKALQLYKLNIQASQALYPLISILEIALRNALDRELTKHLSDSGWLITKRNQFANHPDLIYTNSRGVQHSDHFFTEKLQMAEDKLNFRRVPVTHGKLLAELTFGFWIKFFDKCPVKVLRGCVFQIFQNKPHIKGALVHSHLNSIVTLRNRISHSEPICFNSSGSLCLNTIKKYEENIIESLGWLDTDLRIWAEKMNFFKPVYNRICTLI